MWASNLENSTFLQLLFELNVFFFITDLTKFGDTWWGSGKHHGSSWLKIPDLVAGAQVEIVQLPMKKKGGFGRHRNVWNCFLKNIQWCASNCARWLAITPPLTPVHLLIWKVANKHRLRQDAGMGVAWTWLPTKRPLFKMLFHHLSVWIYWIFLTRRWHIFQPCLWQQIQTLVYSEKRMITPPHGAPMFLINVANVPSQMPLW